MQPVRKRPGGTMHGIVFVTVFMDLLGFGIVIPLLPYYAHTLHASGLFAGALISCYSAMQFAFAPPWGQLSDRIGRRPVILLGLATSTLSYALFASATGLGPAIGGVLATFGH